MDFSEIKTIAVVGLSSDTDKPSNGVASYLQQNDFDIIPVNPKEKEILGEQCYPDISSIPSDVKIDVVDIFRPSDQVMSCVQDAISRKPKVIWMQKGIANEEAKKLAEAAGIEVVMDKCIKIEHSKS